MNFHPSAQADLLIQTINVPLLYHASVHKSTALYLRHLCSSQKKIPLWYFLRQPKGRGILCFNCNISVSLYLNSVSPIIACRIRINPVCRSVFTLIAVACPDLYLCRIIEAINYQPAYKWKASAVLALVVRHLHLEIIALLLSHFHIELGTHSLYECLISLVRVIPCSENMSNMRRILPVTACGMCAAVNSCNNGKSVISFLSKR